MFSAKNEKTATKNEALAAENRVRILMKEEDRMLKKIEEARKQAQKLQLAREASDQKYKQMQEFREKQKADEDLKREQNIKTKLSRSGKYQEVKAAILKQNQADYKRIREQRQSCLEERRNIFENYKREREVLFDKQKSTEVKLK